MGNQKGGGSSRDAKGKGLAVPHPSQPTTVQQATTDLDDPKRLRRIRINRESSQRLRMRREKRIKDMEDMCQLYMARMSGFPESAALLKNQIESLKKENDEIRNNIFALRAQCDAREVEELLLRQELEELKQLYVMQIEQEQQRLQQMQIQEQQQQYHDHHHQFMNPPPPPFPPNHENHGNFFHGN
ncbi:hypothetical protein J5N97_005992 [Dioscorea zingiberensis]|uniref:BZIP domain-containing protein n=1 Tax=Dioscorea zingiberensis TaxID=325984 RepID=A0A9D5D951_9LILI|nr:hypothetical protein J5N97_005992 [Dioscorea zingiberensis]